MGRAPVTAQIGRHPAPRPAALDKRQHPAPHGRIAADAVQHHQHRPPVATGFGVDLDGAHGPPVLIACAFGPVRRQRSVTLLKRPTLHTISKRVCCFASDSCAGAARRPVGASIANSKRILGRSCGKSVKWRREGGFSNPLHYRSAIPPETLCAGWAGPETRPGRSRSGADRLTPPGSLCPICFTGGAAF